MCTFGRENLQNNKGMHANLMENLVITHVISKFLCDIKDIVIILCCQNTPFHNSIYNFLYSY